MPGLPWCSGNSSVRSTCHLSGSGSDFAHTFPRAITFHSAPVLNPQLHVIPDVAFPLERRGNRPLRFRLPRLEFQALVAAEQDQVVPLHDNTGIAECRRFSIALKSASTV